MSIAAQESEYLEIPAAFAELVRRTHDGEVVFFVGAGFSIDSEGLSATHLVERLLLRLHALDQLQAHPGQAMRAFGAVFGVSAELGELWKKGSRATGELARRYYEVNAWMCQVFGELLANAPAADYPAFRDGLAAQERAALALTRREGAGADAAAFVFEAIPESWWDWARALQPHQSEERTAIGKLVFIQTSGLFDQRVMSGPGYDPAKIEPTCPYAFERMYRGRLRPRHHVVARLAREGVCPTVVTTNFDLLLEGAFRLAGFLPACWKEDPPVNLSIPRYDVIASPEEFFQRGKAFRTANLIKLHGCASMLRKRRDKLDRLLRYLPQLVYTYREIQYWRNDSWAAEFLRTLLRTRTFVFASYSTEDPVMHDTFRSVYEEMARQLADAHAHLPVPLEKDVSAPAYFMAYTPDDRLPTQFHGNEILHSASRSVGARAVSATVDHPNYLRFAPLSNDRLRWMNLDETMLWLEHQLLRRQQLEALEEELTSLVNKLVGRRPASELERFRQSFERYLAAEARSIQDARPVTAARRRLREVTNWSHYFHVALRREWARGLALLRCPAAYRHLSELNHPLWYFPASERPEWTAWATVLEMALRHLGRSLVAPAEAPREGPPPVTGSAEVAPAAKPTVLFPLADRPAAPNLALTLQIRDHSRPLAHCPQVAGFPVRQEVWLLPDSTPPWPLDDGREAAPGDRRHAIYELGNTHWRSVPPASLVWDLALNQASPTARHHLFAPRPRP